MTAKITAQAMKARLRKLGVETEIDFAAQRLHVTAIRPAGNLQVRLAVSAILYRAMRGLPV